MERFKNTYLPSTAFAFTAVMLCVCVLNLIEGYEYQNNWRILEVFGYIVVMELVDVLLSRIEFKHYLTYFLTEGVAGYGLFFGLFGYVGNWFSYTPKRMMQVTLIYILIFAALHYYFYRRAQSRADEINEMLKDRSC